MDWAERRRLHAASARVRRMTGDEHQWLSLSGSSRAGHRKQRQVVYRDAGTRTAVAYKSNRGQGSVTSHRASHTKDGTVAVDEDPDGSHDNSVSRRTSGAARGGWRLACQSCIEGAGSGPSAMHSDPNTDQTQARGAVLASFSSSPGITLPAVGMRHRPPLGLGGGDVRFLDDRSIADNPRRRLCSTIRHCGRRVLSQGSCCIAGMDANLDRQVDRFRPGLSPAERSTLPWVRGTLKPPRQS